MLSKRMLALLLAAASAAADDFSPSEAQAFVRSYCVSCHQGRSPAGGRNLATLVGSGIASEPDAWLRVLVRVRDGQMPPAKATAPSPSQRDAFVAWLDGSLRNAACAGGPVPGRSPIRRLNRSEYAATIRDLLDIHINAAHALPSDGAGGEGFDNAAETLTISPIHAEKYLEAARQALGYAFTDTRARRRFITAVPIGDLGAEQAARWDLRAFLARAFRRPVTPAEVERYVDLFRASRKGGNGFDDALLFAFSGALVSPHFLFRLEEPNSLSAPRLVPDFTMASRLSYFLWGSMPDDALFKLAGQGKLREPAVVEGEIARMLGDPKARDFAENFVEQWLGTRELGRDIKPDPAIFPTYYDAELQSAIRYEPVLLFQEIFSTGRPLTDLLDANYTILTNKLQRHYGLQIPKGVKVGQQPVKVDLPPGSHRGGLLGMAAVLAVSSYPNRTSPVLRGKWILDAMLGAPPPPPPPNVPQLKEKTGDASATLRERLTEHRRDATCAACHNRIDPLGFALENYDVLGRYRETDAGKPIDSTGELTDGTRFEGVAGLRNVLLDRREQFVRNLTVKMLGYALGRGLTLADQCAVDHIAAEVAKAGYSAHALVREIVFSQPFRYQEASR